MQTVVISVQDTGSGIKEENINKLFKLFSTFEDKGNNPTGVGLGLAISQKLAEGFIPEKKGGIIVRSQLGVGSEFSFPVLVAEEGFQSLDENTIVRDIPQFSLCNPSFSRESVKRNDYIKTAASVKILLVDDDQFSHSVIENYIKNFKDFEYEGANNGAEAIKKIIQAHADNHQFDLILLDTNMPVMNGFETAIKLSEMIANGDIRPITIASYTADPHDQKKYETLVSFRMHEISKPIFLDDFRKKLEEIFQRTVYSNKISKKGQL